MNKILIIDDDRELCALIKRSVQAENIEADFCNTGKEGLQKLREQEYQLVVLDVMMPGMDGFETLEEIRKENSLPILMFTSKNDSISKVRGLRAGADDYLTKPFDMDELIARIASLIRRYTRFNQQAGAIQKLNFDGLQIDLENRSVTTSNGTFELPPKEFDLLLYCAKHQGKILTKQQIYEEVWGEEYFYDDSNIMAIISRLRKKLEVNPSSPKYITFEPGCRNNWHIHHADKGGGQILVCTAGEGVYQEWGKEPQILHPGDVVYIKPGVKHYHGAAADSWFSHIAVECPGENCSNEWCEPVTDEQYNSAKIERF